MGNNYNWTTNVSPINGIPMYDNGENADLPKEFHPRDSYDVEILKLYDIINKNHEKYHLSMIDSPTDEQRKDIKTLTELLENKLKGIFSGTKKSEHLENDQTINILHEKVLSYHRPEYGDKLDKYDAQYKIIERPFSSNYMSNDDLFSWQRLAGNNPLAIKRVINSNTISGHVYPQLFIRFPSIMGEDDDLEIALNENRVFELDYYHMKDVTAEYGVTKPEGNGSEKLITGYSYMPAAYFCLTKNREKLVPIVIQISRHDKTRVIFSNDGWSWERAKLTLQSADKAEHQLCRHLGITHLLSEAFALATYRNFKNDHPLYKLLISHMEGTNRINHNATLALLRPGQFVDNMIAGNFLNLAKKTIDTRLNYDFYDNFLPADLERRGVDDVNILPDYPYRDDGLLLWGAINDWISEYIRIIYRNDAVLKSDVQLTAWMKDIVTNGKVKGFRIVKTRAELIDVLTMIIFTASAQHAAVNFTQKDYMMYAPWMSGCLEFEGPTQNAPDYTSEEKLYKMMPSLVRSIQKINIYYLLSTPHNGYLGEYVDRDLTPLFTKNDNPEIYNALLKFRKKLNDISEEIAVKNMTRMFPYETLMPKNVPASVNI